MNQYNFVAPNPNGGFDVFYNGQYYTTVAGQQEAENIFNQLTQNASNLPGGAGGGGTTGGIQPGGINMTFPNLQGDVAPYGLLELEIQRMNQLYLMKRLEELEKPQAASQTELQRHQLALDAANSFATQSGWMIPAGYLELMVLKDPNIGAGLPQEAAMAAQGQAPSLMTAGNINPALREQLAGQYVGGGTSGVARISGLPQTADVGWNATQQLAYQQLTNEGQPTDATNVLRRTQDIQQQLWNQAHANLRAGDQAGLEGTAQWGSAVTQEVARLAQQQMTAQPSQPGAIAGGTPGFYERGFGQQPGAVAGGTPGFYAPGGPGIGPQLGGGVPGQYPGTGQFPGVMPTFEREQYMTNLAANPRNLYQTLLMLGYNSQQAGQFLQSTPLVQALTYGGQYPGGAGTTAGTNPAFPFIQGRNLPVRSTLAAIEGQSPMIDMLSGLFSASGQRPETAFQEFQSFLPKGSVMPPTSY